MQSSSGTLWQMGSHSYVTGAKLSRKLVRDSNRTSSGLCSSQTQWGVLAQWCSGLYQHNALMQAAG